MKWETSMDDKLKQIINHYGVLPQLKYLQSEVFEFNEAVIRCENIPSGIAKYIKEHYIEDITEEMADVLVMLFQFKEYYHIDGKEILKIMKEKIDRQLKRIEEELKDSDISEICSRRKIWFSIINKILLSRK